MGTRRELLQKLGIGVLTTAANCKPVCSLHLAKRFAALGTAAGKYLVKVNCGGPEIDGFAADQVYRPGNWGYIHGGQYFKCDSVSNDYGIPEVLSTLRYSCGAPFHYIFDVPNGYYKVKMYFVSPNEFYGQRTFDVLLNGNIAARSLRPFPVNACVVKEFDDIAVAEGRVDITFRSINDACLINAIEVEQLSSRVPVVSPKRNRASGNLTCAFHDDLLISYYGDWSTEDDSHQSSAAGSALDFTFKDSTIRWIGPRGPDHGIAEVYVDGSLQETVDAYSPKLVTSTALFERSDLSRSKYHTIRIVLSKEKHPHSSGIFQAVRAFECEEPFDAAESDADAAFREVAIIEAGQKSYSAPEQWRPVENAAVAPDRGVVLHDGMLRLAFERNVAYQINNWNMHSSWTTWLPGANDGRRLAAAGNILRWTDNPTLRNNSDSLVQSIAARQRADGYALPYSDSDMGKIVYGANNERKPYDRRNFVLGLLAAGWANPLAFSVARKFQDWLYASSYVNTMLDGALGIMGDQPNLAMFYSPAGKKEDVIVREKYWRQDWWLRELTEQQPTAISRFPLNRSHSYVIAPWIAYVDTYRATGDPKCIEAMLGAWQAYRDNFVHVGGSAGICEDCDNAYPAKSYYLNKHTGENCGGALWIEFNHRLSQLYPDEEKFASEIEQTLYNVTLANQDDGGNIRYHTNLIGTKDAAKAIGTCCEVTNTTILARLPEFLYSIAADGLYMNMYSPSSITWKRNEGTVTVQISTAFPYNTSVAIKLTLERPMSLKIHLRIPSWATGVTDVAVNGQHAATGSRGTYLTLGRTWANGDTISFTIPIGFRLTKYNGFDRDNVYDRYALQYGPLLMALVGGTHLDISPKDLIGRLTAVPESPLQFAVDGANCKYVPYVYIADEAFTSFPTFS